MFHLEVWKEYKDELRKNENKGVTCFPNLEGILIKEAFFEEKNHSANAE